jgi:hypothetical protein
MYGIPIGPPSHMPAPKSAWNPRLEPIVFTIDAELVSTGSVSTGVFQMLSAGRDRTAADHLLAVRIGGEQGEETYRRGPRRSTPQHRTRTNHEDSCGATDVPPCRAGFSGGRCTPGDGRATNYRRPITVLPENLSPAVLGHNERRYAESGGDIDARQPHVSRNHRAVARFCHWRRIDGVCTAASARGARPARRAISVDESSTRIAQLRRGSAMGWPPSRRHSTAANGPLHEQGLLQRPRVVDGRALLALQLSSPDRRHAKWRRRFEHSRSTHRRQPSCLGPLG